MVLARGGIVKASQIVTGFLSSIALSPASLGLRSQIAAFKGAVSSAHTEYVTLASPHHSPGGAACL